MSTKLQRHQDPRISPETEPDEEQEKILSKTLLTPDSDPLNLFRVLVRYPELMKRVNGLGGLFMAHGSLSKRERELVILRVAWRTRCDYEFAQHSPIGRRVGLTDPEIAALGDRVEEFDWKADDAALLRFTDQIMDSLEVSDATWEAVHRNHTDAQMMELVMLVGYYRSLAGFLKTLRVPLEEGAPRLPIEE